jgi:thiol-disulfide isomerase/thioredoxin
MKRSLDSPSFSPRAELSSRGADQCGGRIPRSIAIAGLLFAIGLLLGPTTARAAPGGSSEAVDLLNKATAAAQKLTALSYDVTMQAEGGLANAYPKLFGKVIARRGSTDLTHKLLVEGTVTTPGAMEPSTFKFATDGAEAFSIDTAARTFTSGKTVEQGLMLGHPLFQPRYLHQTPFKDGLDNPTLKYEGVRTQGGVECQVVSFSSPGNGGQASRLFLGKEDLLLRRIETTVNMTTQPGQPPVLGTIVFAVSNLSTQPKIDDAMFRLQCPPGFTPKPFEMPKRPGQPELLPVGKEAPDWELKDAAGKTVSLKGLRGKFVVLDFWATWCGPCKMSMPSMQKLHERFKDKPVVVYGVNCREYSPQTDPMAYVRKQGYTYGQLLQGSAVADAYQVGGIPCLYLIGPDGKIMYALAGFNPQMEQLLAEMIEKASKKT